MIAFQIPGEPIAFARAGSLGKRRFTPKKQSDFMGVVRLYAGRAMEGLPPFPGALRLTVRATYLVPGSWSKKRQAAAVWKVSKPDADNIAKLVKDACNKIVFVDDAQVAELIVQKKYGPVASLVVSVEEL